MTMYTKIIFVLLIVGYVLSTSVELDQTEDNTVDTNYWTDVRNDFILDAATISMGTLMVYPEYLSSASIECKHQINLYNGAYDVYQNDILRSIDYSSDGTNDFSGYQNCTEMGFRYLIVHYDDKMRSTHYGIKINYC